jgi:hypothetical protein
MDPTGALAQNTSVAQHNELVDSKLAKPCRLANESRVYSTWPALQHTAIHSPRFVVKVSNEAARQIMSILTQMTRRILSSVQPSSKNLRRAADLVRAAAVLVDELDARLNRHSSLLVDRGKRCSG